MGNKLSSCGPLIKKSYRYDDVAGPFQSSSRRRDGHLLRLWAEVFHVSAKGEEIKWQQISEDLVPVNITCVQDAPDYIFHITAYNSQVEKIMDIRLVQPGTKIGLASECFAYWKEPHTNDTWGLNFTSPIDAKQFKECCTPSMKLSRKSSSSYSLKLDTSKRQSTKVRRKPLSTPTSPSRSREPQCTCMTADQFNRLRAQDPRYNKERSSTLPRSHTRQLSLGDGPSDPDKKLSAEDTSKQTISRSSNTRDRETATPGGKLNITGTGSQTEQGQQQDSCKSEGVQTVGAKTTTTTGTCTPRMSSKDYSDGYMESEMFKPANVPKSSRNQNKAYRDDYRYRDGMGTMKRTLKPMPSLESPATSPEMTRRRGYSYYHQPPPASTMNLPMPHCSRQAQSESESSAKHRNSRFGTLGSRSSYDIGRAEQSMRDHPRGLYLELDRNGRPTQPADGSPLSDTVMFDNQCYATTPSSSNGRGYQKHDNQATSTPGSPTSRLLLEYEMHLRNTLARGMDAESYSLHTFEALLTQSMENLEMAEQLPPLNSRSPYPTRRRPMSAGGSFNRSSTLPHRVERSSSATREGYYSDRQDAARERDRERGYLSDHATTSNRCVNCWNESARAHWFRHSDGWRCGSSAMGSGTSSINCVPHGSFDYVHHHTPPGKQSKRSAWESLPSLRHENSLAADNACKSNRNDSFEQRMFERQDSGRLDYLTERAARHSFSGITQQASVESTDSRLCYLTSSEVYNSTT